MTLAPMALAMSTAASPTPPHPNTATHSPGSTFPWAVIPWKAVMNRQPRLAPSTKEMLSGSVHQVHIPWVTMVYSPNPPAPLNMDMLRFSQTCWSPWAQVGQWPQA